MTSPLARMIDSAVRCTICGAPMGGCGCWTKCDCGWSFQKSGECRNPVHGKGGDGILTATHMGKLKL